MFPTPVKLRKKDWLYLDVIEDLVSDKCMFCPEIWDNCTASTPKESLSKIWEIACLWGEGWSHQAISHEDGSVWEVHDIYWLDPIHLAVAATLLEQLRRKATVSGKDGIWLDSRWRKKCPGMVSSTLVMEIPGFGISQQYRLCREEEGIAEPCFSQGQIWWHLWRQLNLPWGSCLEHFQSFLLPMQWSALKPKYNICVLSQVLSKSGLDASGPV